MFLFAKAFHGALNDTLSLEPIKSGIAQLPLFH